MYNTINIVFYEIPRSDYDKKHFENVKNTHKELEKLLAEEEVKFPYEVMTLEEFKKRYPVKKIKVDVNEARFEPIPYTLKLFQNHGKDEGVWDYYNHTSKAIQPTDFLQRYVFCKEESNNTTDYFISKFRTLLNHHNTGFRDYLPRIHYDPQADFEVMIVSKANYNKVKKIPGAITLGTLKEFIDGFIKQYHGETLKALFDTWEYGMLNEFINGTANKHNRIIELIRNKPIYKLAQKWIAAANTANFNDAAFLKERQSTLDYPTKIVIYECPQSLKAFTRIIQNYGKTVNVRNRASFHRRECQTNFGILNILTALNKEHL